jgi:predicted SAM-dependent methyltransferase
VLARRSILDLVGGFSEDHRLKALEDYDLWLRVASFSAIYFLPETLANYWDYGNSLHSKQTLIDHWKGLLFILARLDSFLSTRHIDDPVLKERIRKQAYLLRKYTFQVHWKNKNYLPGIFTLWGLVIKHPDELLALGTRQIRVLWNRLSLWGKAQSEENMPALHAKTKLHLGCGEIYLDGYVNIDFPPSEHTVQRISRADRYADIVELSYPPGTIAEVRLHHVFENFDRVTALYLLMQWYQWLEEGGQLVIETPDFQACALRFLQNGDAGAQDKLLRHLFGSNEAAWAIHKDGWYENKYIRVLHSLGYCDLHFRFSEWQGTYNITVMAKKKRPLVSQDEQLAEIHQLLRHYLVNGEASELVTYQVWIEQLNQLMKRGV